MGSAQQSAGDAIQAPYAIMGNKSLYSVRVIDVAWSSDSSMIICCGDQGPTGGLEVAYVFSVADNCTIAELTGEPGIEFNQASFSSDNRLVALTRIDGKVSSRMLHLHGCMPMALLLPLVLGEEGGFDAGALHSSYHAGRWSFSHELQQRG